MSLNNRRSKKAFHVWGNTQKSITEILQDPNVQNYVKRGTYASKREKLRKLLKNKEITQELVEEHARRNPMVPQQVQDTMYGSQRRRANLPRRTRRGEVLYGPDPPPRPRRRPGGAIIISGENLTARQALERYPQLRGFLQPKKRLSEKSLPAKLRTWFKNGKIPDHLINEQPPEFQRTSSALDSTFVQYKLDDLRIHHHDIVSIFDNLKSQILKLIRTHPNAKVYLNIHVMMYQPSSDTHELKGHRTGAQEFLVGTDPEMVLNTLRDIIYEGLAKLENVVDSGWVQERI